MKFRFKLCQKLSYWKQNITWYVWFQIKTYRLIFGVVSKTNSWAQFFSRHLQVYLTYPPWVSLSRTHLPAHIRQQDNRSSSLSSSTMIFRVSKNLPVLKSNYRRADKDKQAMTFQISLYIYLLTLWRVVCSWDNKKSLKLPNTAQRSIMEQY